MTATLYYSPSSCGAANFIAAFKAGLIQNGKIVAHPVQGYKVLPSGVDFYSINPKGNVPSITFGDNLLLNENAATLQYIADLNPAALLAPANGTDARYVLQSKLNWLSSELHGRIGPLFGPSEPAIKDFLLARFNKTLTYLNDVELNGKKSFLVGNNFTIADSYCYIILTWTPYLGISFAHLPNVVSFFEGIKALDFVQAAHAEMNAKCSAAGYKF